MNILFLCDEYPPGKNGGIGTAVQTLSRELVKLGHSVFVAGLYAYSYGEKNYEEDHDVKVWRLRYGPDFGKFDTGYKVYRKMPAFVAKNWNGRRAFSNYVKFIKDLIDKENIHIVEAPDWNTFSMFIGFVPQWPEFKVPFLLRSHGSYTYFSHELNEPKNKHMWLCDSTLFDRADALSAVSAYTAELNAKLFKLKLPCRIIPNAVRIGEANERKNINEFQVFFSGALIEKKGVFSLMRAWNLVHASNPQAKLLVYGKGKIGPLQQLLSISAKNSVEFGGHVSREKVFSALSKSALAVFPSFSETFGIMCIEAMAVNCPVVYTKRSCGPEIVVDGVTGELVNPDDHEEIAAVILKLLANPALAKQYATNAHRRAAKLYDTTQVVAQHIAFYETEILNFKLTKAN